MKVYFVRHGESEHNAKSLYQPTDSPLSEEGIKQAEFVAERFRNIPIDIILASPFVRTRQTAETINKVVNKEIVWVEELKELIRPSVFIEKHWSSTETTSIHDELKKHKDDPDWHHSDEENFFDLKNRALKLLEILGERTEENILAVSHGEYLRMIIAIMMIGPSLTASEFDNIHGFLKTINTGITVCMKENDRWRLLTWNDHAHLG